MKAIVIEPCPQIKNVGNQSKRLIDTGLLHHKASIAGFSERYRRGETSHTIHVWWARRPHVAMRLLIYATVCKNTSKKNVEVMNQLSVLNGNEKLLEKARQFVKEGYARTPKILDMFGGGGTISYEALNLGLDSYSIDSNELSVFIQKAHLQYRNDMKEEDFIAILKKSGERVLNHLKKLTAPIFPSRNQKNGKQTTNYLWAYSYPCKHCGGQFSLSKRFWLSKKKERQAFIDIGETLAGPIFHIKKGKTAKNQTNWLKKSNVLQCPHCQNKVSNISVKKAKEILVVEVVKEKIGKSFQKGRQLDPEIMKKIKRLEDLSLKALQSHLPKSDLPKWSGIVNPALYGIEKHADIFHPRQRVTCLALLKVLKDEYDYISQEEGTSTAKYIISLLSGLVDQVVDWNSRMSIWIPQNEQVGRAFCGPGISMYWDFCETDPVAFGPSNLHAKLKRIIKGAKAIKKLHKKGYVKHAFAQNLPFKDKMFDAIVTDPPYYDNIFYTVLADNFYAWKRMLLKHVEPELFKNESTNFENELVASTQRKGSKAHKDYCINLDTAIKEASRVLKDDGTMSFVYSHRSILGWEAMIQAFRHSSLFFTSVQPLSIERRQRPRAIRSEAVNTCMAFIAKKSHQAKLPISVDALLSKCNDIIKGNFIHSLQRLGWLGEDIAIGLMAQAVALVSNAIRIENTDDKEALLEVEKLIAKKFPKFTLSKRKSL